MDAIRNAFSTYENETPNVSLYSHPLLIKNFFSQKEWIILSFTHLSLQRKSCRTAYTEKESRRQLCEFGALGNAAEYISRTMLLERPDARPSTTLSEVHRRSRSSMQCTTLHSNWLEAAQNCSESSNCSGLLTDLQSQYDNER